MSDCIEVEKAVRAILNYVGEDPNREGLRETPRRFCEALAEWTAGYAQSPSSVLKVFEDGASQCDEMIFQGAIPIWSMCEHHMAPFFGVVHIGYIPRGRIIGLSKMARLADIYARRLQVQERLTNQIAEVMFNNIDFKPQGVGVVLRCRHTCIESRGVNKSGSWTVTSALRGVIKEVDRARSEFFSLVAMADRG